MSAAAAAGTCQHALPYLSARQLRALLLLLLLLCGLALCSCVAAAGSAGEERTAGEERCKHTRMRRAAASTTTTAAAARGGCACLLLLRRRLGITVCLLLLLLLLLLCICWGAAANGVGPGQHSVPRPAHKQEKHEQHFNTYMHASRKPTGAVEQPRPRAACRAAHHSTARQSINTHTHLHMDEYSMNVDRSWSAATSCTWNT
jgi:hypothetical protein